MLLHLDWQTIALRLFLTIVGCVLIGVNREEHRLAAGLRTTLMVGLAAAFAMIQVNLLLTLSGKASDSFVVMDLMRLPLGILSGMGFIGAGAILRKDNIVMGVTTAATLWFVTVMGLCFGGGEIGLGVCSMLLGFAILTGLKYFEKHFERDHKGLLVLAGGIDKIDPDSIPKISQIIGQKNFQASVNVVVLSETNHLKEIKYEVTWCGHAILQSPPKFLADLAAMGVFTEIKWEIVV